MTFPVLTVGDFLLTPSTNLLDKLVRRSEQFFPAGTRALQAVLSARARRI